jgi:hypothetical protein
LYKVEGDARLFFRIGRLLRLAGSLRLGTVQASGLIRTLQTKDQPARIARALEEVGRLVKALTVFDTSKTGHIDGESWCNSIAARDAINSPAWCSRIR